MKKISTSASRVGKVVGMVVFLEERVKGFFSDGVEQWKIRF